MVPAEAYDQAVRVEWKLIASLRADSPSISNVQLAARCGVNVNTITRWLQDPNYQRYENFVLTASYNDRPGLLEDKRDVAEILTNNAPEMIDRLYGIIQMAGDPKLEADLCQDWLDRAGYAPQRKVAQVTQRPIVMTGEAMEIFLRRMKEAGLNPVIEVAALTAQENGHS